MKIKITLNDIGKRLDVFLTEQLDLSRSQIQKKIKSGEVLITGNLRPVHYFLKANDVIEIAGTKKTLSASTQAVKSKKTTNKELFKQIKIISETEDYLVINKPAGLLVHADDVHNEATLVDWLIKKYSKLPEIFSDKVRPGIVHRLDRDVSGLMIIAKTPSSFANLKKQFKSRKTKKVYLALVYGNVEPESGTISRPIARSKSRGKMIARTDQKNEDAKNAITDFEVIEKYGVPTGNTQEGIIKYTLLKIFLKTGRTHQIRVHLNSIGHSIVGDKLYATRDLKNKKLPDIKNIFLCSTELGFKDLTKNWQEFKIQLPKYLRDFLKTIE